MRYREGREGAALSARRALSSPRPLLAAVPASKRNSRPLQPCTICTAQLAPDDDGRALEDPSAVVKAARTVLDAVRKSNEGNPDLKVLVAALLAVTALLPSLSEPVMASSLGEALRTFGGGPACSGGQG